MSRTEFGEEMLINLSVIVCKYASILLLVLYEGMSYQDRSFILKKNFR